MKELRKGKKKDLGEHICSAAVGSARFAFDTPRRQATDRSCQDCGAPFSACEVRQIAHERANGQWGHICRQSLYDHPETRCESFLKPMTGK